MPELVWTSLVIMTSLGVLGTVLMAFLSHWLVYSVIKVPHSLRIETLWTLYVLAAGLPFVLSTAGLRGVLEAHQCFKVINLVRIPMSAFTFLGPVIVLEVRNSLVLIAAALLLGRVITWGLYLYMCLSVMPALRTGIRARRAIIRPLLATGGWMTVSNIVSPLMGYLDRLVIGAVISVSAVAYYVTPNEMVTKLWQIPGALVGVLFP